MDIKSMDIQSDIFDEIVEDIKQKNLSKNNMPKLIVGTGLSMIYGVPGMGELAKYINNEINKSSDSSLKDMWNKRYDVIKTKGLEVGLADLARDEQNLADTIKPLTAKYILKSEEGLHAEVLERDTGFSRLLEYLSNTLGANHKMIDVMTPNYDRIVEIICDKVGIGVITGFVGNIYGKFNRNILRKPQNTYNCQQSAWVRLFKPHGSLNWINENGNEYLINDYDTLMKKAEFIEIVTPGSSKYRAGLVNNTFRCMREDFNELIRGEEHYSLLIYGYGFNDDHFDTALFDSFQRNVLIVSRDVKQEILGKAMSRKNITIFYHENHEDYMIYKSHKYRIDLPLWDIDQFADIFIG